MDWKMMNDLLKFAIGSGVVGFVIRSLFALWIDKDFEKYKSQLVNERFKYTKLHEARGEIIAEIYALLSDFESKMTSLMSPIQISGDLGQKDKLKYAGEAGKSFVEYFISKKIFFSKKVVHLLEDLNDNFIDAWRDFTTYPVNDFGEWEPGEIKKEKWTLYRSAWDTLKKEIPPIKERLEEEFRAILGVE